MCIPYSSYGLYFYVMSTTRADYTYPEWNTMQTAVIGTGFLVRKLTPNFFESWKAKRAAENIINHHEENNSDNFFRELCDEEDFKSRVPGYLPRSAGAMEVPVLQAIDASLDILRKKDPSKLEPFKDLILHIANATADSVDGISEQEQHAIDSIYTALQDKQNFGDLDDLTNPFEPELS